MNAKSRRRRKGMPSRNSVIARQISGHSSLSRSKQIPNLTLPHAPTRPPNVQLTQSLTIFEEHVRQPGVSVRDINHRFMNMNPKVLNMVAPICPSGISPRGSRRGSHIQPLRRQPPAPMAPATHYLHKSGALNTELSTITHKPKSLHLLFKGT